MRFTVSGRTIIVCGGSRAPSETRPHRTEPIFFTHTRSGAVEDQLLPFSIRTFLCLAGAGFKHTGTGNTIAKQTHKQNRGENVGNIYTHTDPETRPPGLSFSATLKASGGHLYSSSLSRQTRQRQLGFTPSSEIVGSNPGKLSRKVNKRE